MTCGTVSWPALCVSEPLCPILIEKQPQPFCCWWGLTSSHAVWPHPPRLCVFACICICLLPNLRACLQLRFQHFFSHACSQTADVCSVSNGAKRVSGLTSVRPAPAQLLDCFQIWMIKPCRGLFHPFIFFKGKSQSLIFQSFRWEDNNKNFPRSTVN